MLFNSIDFAIFFLAFFSLYWFLLQNNLKLQNVFILIASYLFYAWVDLRFLPLLIVGSGINYVLGIIIFKTKNETKKKFLLILGLIQGVGSLVFFKYSNFLLATIADLLSFTPIEFSAPKLNLLLPLGISFYTFRTLSYILDIYKGKLNPITNLTAFYCYVAFFPCIVAGPIDKPGFFIPQLLKQRVFNYHLATDGLRQMLWGFFKKVVVADNCAYFANQIFDNYQNLPASTLLLGAFFFTIQIYADFSGYSDIAIGLGRLLGFNITRNFNYPLFARNIVEFWRKWHMSLTTWLTEYVFTPLSIQFRDFGKFGIIIAILINFTLIGIWHGPSWNYVLFGFLHGCFFIPFILNGTMNKKKPLPANVIFIPVKDMTSIFATFLLVMFTFIVFRTQNLTEAIDYLSRLFSLSLLSPIIIIGKLRLIYTLVFIAVMLSLEWLYRDSEILLSRLTLNWPKQFRLALYYQIVITIFIFAGIKQNFIYLQF